ncbi:hypothetical protein G4B88_012202 [Cannabis sativa]|uniref:Uncharacterized protein n=1 Tax=Cannabis sativa TaxID=3483 RepID=A0A7J6I4B3_CANSA|nr:hypothetical protein G4B88_012202 [Cannabis sativa]
MRGRSYSYSPSPTRGYSSRRRRSPSPRGRYGGRDRDLPTSLLVRNLRLDCSIQQGGLQVAIPDHHAMPEPILAVQTIIPHLLDEDITRGQCLPGTEDTGAGHIQGHLMVLGATALAGAGAAATALSILDRSKVLA